MSSLLIAMKTMYKYSNNIQESCYYGEMLPCISEYMTKIDLSNFTTSLVNNKKD